MAFSSDLEEERTRVRLGCRQSARRTAWQVAGLGIVLAALAPAQQLSLKQYGQEQGLQNLVGQFMLQDKKGFLWVATQSGLFRYDGTAFRGYFGEHGLPSSWIASLHETVDGTLWVATDAGVVRRVGDRFEAIAGAGEYEVQSRASLASDSAGTVYVATDKGLVVVRPGAGGRPPAARFADIGVETGPVSAVYIDAAGDLWAACRERILRVARWRLFRGAAKGLDRNPGLTWYGPDE